MVIKRIKVNIETERQSTDAELIEVRESDLYDTLTQDDLEEIDRFLDELDAYLGADDDE